VVDCLLFEVGLRYNRFEGLEVKRPIALVALLLILAGLLLSGITDTIASVADTSILGSEVTNSMNE